MNQPPNKKEITINKVQYDYFTLTSYDDDLYERFAKIANESEDIREAKVQQYQGHKSYFDNGSIFVGTGLQGPALHNLVRLEGPIAEDCKIDVKHSIRDDNARLTRVDIQVTILQPDNYAKDGQWRLFNRINRNEHTPGWAESADPVHGKLITVYRGSRSSDRFARVYQKPVRADRPALRLEFQLNRRRAEPFGLAWVAGRVDSRTAFKALLEWFDDEEIRHMFEMAVDGFHPLLPKTLRRETKTERWLLTQVLTAFTRYINMHDDDGRVSREFEQAIREAHRWGRGVD